MLQLKKRIPEMGAFLVLIGIVGWAAMTIAAAKDPKDSPAENVLFVVDKSGSMTSQLPQIRSAVSSVVGSLKSNHRAGLLAFSGCSDADVEVVVPMKKRAGKKIVAALNSIQPGGSTALALALSKTKTMMETLNVCPRLVLFTDNQDTCGGNVQAILDDFKANRDEYCLELDVVTSSEDEETLKGLLDLANDLGGNLYKAADQSEILEAIQRILAKAKRGDSSVRGTDKEKNESGDDSKDPNYKDEGDPDSGETEKEEAKAEAEKDQENQDQENQDQENQDQGQY